MQILWDLCCLASPCFCHNDHNLVLLHSLQDLLPEWEDGEGCSVCGNLLASAPGAVRTLLGFPRFCFLWSLKVALSGQHGRLDEIDGVVEQQVILFARAHAGLCPRLHLGALHLLRLPSLLLRKGVGHLIICPSVPLCGSLIPRAALLWFIVASRHFVTVLCDGLQLTLALHCQVIHLLLVPQVRLLLLCELHIPKQVLGILQLIPELIQLHILSLSQVLLARQVSQDRQQLLPFILCFVLALGLLLLFCLGELGAIVRKLLGALIIFGPQPCLKILFLTLVQQPSSLCNTLLLGSCTLLFLILLFPCSLLFLVLLDPPCCILLVLVLLPPARLGLVPQLALPLVLLLAAILLLC
mmetsp:Transcript_7114/g.19116  ORF Transcript_7114/g.19116 Transcript_7114/m.19116 type:complete len:355 (-) Transcript_7114:493-1557(-)